MLEKIKDVMLISWTLPIVIVIIVGLSIFLNFMYKHLQQHTTCLNILFSHFALFNIVYSIFISGEIFIQVFEVEQSDFYNKFLKIWLVKAKMGSILYKTLMFILLTIFTILRRFFLNCYILINNVPNVGKKLAFLHWLVVSALLAGFSYLCLDTVSGEPLEQCKALGPKVVFFPMTIIIFLGQILIILDWTYQQRTKIQKWITDKWNTCLMITINAVVPQDAVQEDLEDDPEIVGSMTLALTFFLRLVNIGIGILFGFEDTVSTRAIINLLTILATTTIWIYNSQNLVIHTKKVASSFKNLVAGFFCSSSPDNAST